MYACQYCEYEDTTTMVQCDICDLWAHFECVGVGAEVEKMPWSCFQCREVFRFYRITECLINYKHEVISVFYASLFGYL